MRFQIPKFRHGISRRFAVVGSLVGAVVTLGTVAAPAAGLNVINESQSVIPSQCVGSTCSTTSNPSETLVLRTGDTPAIRFDQTGAGYPDYIWDLAANEANFFIRDVTGGDNLIFRVFPGSPPNALTIGPGGVGLGTSSPDTSLHVRHVGAGLKVEDRGPAGPARVLADLVAAGAPLIQLRDTEASGTSWQLGAGDSGGFVVRPVGDDVPESFAITPAGSARALGVLEQGADAAVLTDLAPVNQNEILNKLRTLSISSWTTPGDATGARHLGPSGSDFRQSFGLGGSDESIAPVDLAAVGLVATKALATRLDQRLSSVDGRLKAVESNEVSGSGDPPMAKERALRLRVTKQTKRIRGLTRRQRATARHLRKLSRRVHRLSQTNRSRAGQAGHTARR